MNFHLHCASHYGNEACGEAWALALRFEFEEEADGAGLGRTGEQLLLLAKAGAPGELLTSMLNLALNDQLSKEHSRFLCAPIIQHQSQWMETTPGWMYQAILHDRLQIVLDEIKSGETGFKVGPIELATVMYPATMDAPIRYELSQIYLWAAAQANAFNYGRPVEEIYGNLNMRPIPDDEVTNPSGQYYYIYRELCSEIRRKVVNAQIERERTLKKNAQPELKQRSKIQGQQLNLF